MSRTDGSFIRAVDWCLFPAIVVLSNRLLEGILYWLSGWGQLRGKVWRDVATFVASGAVLGYSVVGLYRFFQYDYGGVVGIAHKLVRFERASPIGSAFEVSAIEDIASILWWVIYVWCFVKNDQRREMLNSSIDISKSNLRHWSYFAASAFVGAVLRFLLPYTYIEVLSER